MESSIDVGAQIASARIYDQRGHRRGEVIGIGLKDIGGVLVSAFADDNSAAKKAGMQEGDVIVAVDGKPVAYVAQLQGARTPSDFPPARPTPREIPVTQSLNTRRLIPPSAHQSTSRSLRRRPPSKIC